MKEIKLQDSLRVSDSTIKGFVVMEREDGTTVFAKPNMIVENGRNYIKELVYNQVATTTMDTRKFSHISFGSGITPTSPVTEDLEAPIITISNSIINTTSKIWSEYLGNDNPTPDNTGLNLPTITTEVEGDTFLSTRNNKLYYVANTLEKLSINNAIGLKITIDVTGTTATTESSSELGLFLTDGEVSPTYTLFSRVVFDPIPITDTFKYKLTYFIYF
jgi:hypothetical protein